MKAVDDTSEALQPKKKKKLLKLGDNPESDKRMKSLIKTWQASKRKILDYYEEQIRQGKMPAYSDE